MRSGSLSAIFAEDLPDTPSIMAVGDFNGDGIADVVEARALDGNPSGPHTLTVLLGRPDGRFLTEDSLNLIGSDPRALVVGDFNRDGNLDVIAGDGNGSLLEFQGNGKGQLGPSSKIAAVGSVVSIAVGHFTHNGNLDLAVSDPESNSVEILLGAGDGSFRQIWSFPLPLRGKEFHLAAADFNRDGVTDLVITSDDDEDYEVMLGNGNGTFTYAPKLSHVKDPNSYCPT
ncbi:MAG: FG-GAP repeat domain-containing protein [Acidobacteriota bacterium]